MPKIEQTSTLIFSAVKWHGYVIAGVFLVYGGIKIVLSFLDRTFTDIGQSFVFLLVGLLLISIVIAYRSGKLWGWYGLVTVNSAVILLSLFGLGHIESIVLLAISLLALTALMSPAIKSSVFNTP